ncbi:hypothetical protein GCM10009123_11300 [Kangiella japonica]|uniref:diguanylate cyclase n=1 Tax=Kangiella japonica TaxID=647384 RepID=A0ABN0SXR1_9GAMM
MKLINEKLEFLSRQDQLTNIFNRRGFELATQKVFKLAVRNKNTVTFAVLDVDNFKFINDSLGHSAGDKCLEFIGERLRDIFKRDTDFVGRYGGEEFVVLIAEGTGDMHLDLLERLRASIESGRVPYEGQQVKMTVSIGAYTLSEDFSLSYEGIIKKADDLLYISKRSGKNKITHKEQ